MAPTYWQIKKVMTAIEQQKVSPLLHLYLLVSYAVEDINTFVSIIGDLEDEHLIHYDRAKTFVTWLGNTKTKH